MKQHQMPLFLVVVQAICPLFLDISLEEATAATQIFSYSCSGLLSLVGIAYTIHKMLKLLKRQRENSENHKK